MVTSSISTPNAIINGPYGLNGFADVLQSPTDTNSYRYTYTYAQYAVFSHLNFCLDSDNDGIPDLVDIDDDNDGVLDATEAICPSCDVNYPVPESRVVWQSIPPNVSDTAVGSVTRNGETISVVASTTKKFSSVMDAIFGAGTGVYKGCPSTAALTNSMLTIYDNNYTVTISFEQPVWNPSIMFASFDQTVVNFPRPVYVSGLQGSVGGVTLNSYINSFPPTENIISVIYPGVYSQVSFTVPGTDHWGGIIVNVDSVLGSETIVHADSLYNPCKDVDLDHDGIISSIDLDSDGDGCPDAKEAATYNQPGVTTSNGNVKNGSNGSVTSTISTANAIINGPYGGNGFANILQNPTDTNKYNYNYTYTQFAINPAINLCTDTDNDGVPDYADIDDDNDGILDAVEAPSCYYTSTEAIDITTATSDLSFTSPIQNAVDNNFATFATLTGSQLIAGKIIYQFQFPTPVRLSQLTDSLNSTTGIVIPGSSYRIEATNEPDGIWTPVSGNITAPASPGAGNHMVWTLTSPSSYAYYRIVGISGSTANGNSREFKATLFPKYTASLNPKPTCSVDTDNDGITNDKDLDSDGDGCTDARETETYNKAGVTSSTASVQNGSGGTVTSTLTRSNAVINGPYGGNGFANVLQASADTNSYKYTYNYSDAINAAISNACKTIADTIHTRAGCPSCQVTVCKTSTEVDTAGATYSSCGATTYNVTGPNGNCFGFTPNVYPVDTARSCIVMCNYGSVGATFFTCGDPVGYQTVVSENGCYTYVSTIATHQEATTCIVGCNNGLCDTTYVKITPFTNVLPITISDFYGKVSGNNTSQLIWIVSEDLNAAQYSILKSSDQQSWKTIGSISAKGATVKHMYQLTDNNASETNFYKLMIKDLSGEETSYPKVVYLNGASSVNEFVNVYPNPANATLSFEYNGISGDANVHIFITDITGRKVRAMDKEFHAGKNVLTLDLTGLSEGTYFINYQNVTNGNSGNIKFVKSKK